MDLALTLDYELFGDGSGNMFENVIIPTKKILDICNAYNAKITIFFEVVEYWRMKNEWISGNKMGYIQNPAAAMEEQVIDAYRHGHDVQLHIHSQWVNAKYKDGAWLVDDNWCMKDIPVSQENTFGTDLKRILFEGKQTLEDILKPTFPFYKCNIFRAGGYNILPSESIIKILEELEFKVDSSVFAGGYDVSYISNKDFRSITNTIPYWSISNGNVLNQKNIMLNSMIELPIYALPVRRYEKYDFSRLKVIMKNKKSAQKTLQDRVSGRNFFQKIMFFLEKEYITWDFCLFNIKKMKTFIAHAQQAQNQIGYHPFVLIGHSKGFDSEKTLKFLLEADKKINFITMTQMRKSIEQYQKENKVAI